MSPSDKTTLMNSKYQEFHSRKVYWKE